MLFATTIVITYAYTVSNYIYNQCCYFRNVYLHILTIVIILQFRISFRRVNGFIVFWWQSLQEHCFFLFLGMQGVANGAWFYLCAAMVGAGSTKRELIGR